MSAPEGRDEAPWCPYCGLDATLTDGAAMVPHAPARAAEPLWACVPCDAFVRCHRNSTRSMGLPARADLRRRRKAVHDDLLDPLWRNAHLSVRYAGRDLGPETVRNIRWRARERVYAYLADALDVSAEEAHVGMLDHEGCALAEAALAGLTYEAVLAWAEPIEDARRVVAAHARREEAAAWRAAHPAGGRGVVSDGPR